MRSPERWLPVRCNRTVLIILDYDGTYTLAPQWWDCMIASAQNEGHEIICATMRYETEPIEMPCPIIYTGRKEKMAFLSALGIKPDVWIDDAPHFLTCDGT